MSFDTFGLSAELLRAVAEEGYRDPTPIQRQAMMIPGRRIVSTCVGRER